MENFLLDSLVVLMIGIVVHEAMHAVVSTCVGLPIKTIGIGIRMPPKLEGVLKSGVVWWVSPWLVFAMVSPYPAPPLKKSSLLQKIKSFFTLVDDSKFLNEEPWKRFVIVLVGPLSNLVMAILPAMVFFGPDNGLKFTEIVTAKLLPFLNWPTVMPDLTGHTPIQVEWAMVFFVINMVLFITNILPLPPLDGGHLFLALLDDFLPVGGSHKHQRIWLANLVAVVTMTALIIFAGVGLVAVIVMLGSGLG